MKGMLLQDMANQLNCTYISDLRFLPEPDVIKVFLKYIPSHNSIDDWNQTAWYLVGKKVSFSSELEVRDYIINSDLPRLL